MKQLKVLTRMNSAYVLDEFHDMLQDFFVKPLEGQGCKFLGHKGIISEDGPGVNILMFQCPSNKGIGGKDLDIPLYEDEATNSHHYYFYGILYIYIPMPW